MNGVPRGAEFDAELRRRRGLGESMSAIAAALGVTKNVVIGRLHRLGETTPKRKRKRKTAPARNVFPPSGHCLYGIGDFGDPEFRFCGQRAETPGGGSGPWCATHRARVFIGGGRAPD